MAREQAELLARPMSPFLALGLLACGAAAAIPAVAKADARSAPRRFDIVGGELGRALKAFSEQAGLPVMTLADVGGRTARRVSGRMPPERALAALLSGQGLDAQYVAGGYILKESRRRPVPGAVAAPAAPPIELDGVVVTGFRDSLLHAHDIKRQAIGSQDVILAEDIAAFPDLNLAESLQRIPGVTISRDAGEGRQITLRGLGPDFVRTQLNGMEVSASTSSGFDNRGSVSRTRAFDYSIFAAELFNKVTVEKSYAAEQDEGGIAGTVGLHTARPFDYPDPKVAFSAKLLSNSNTAGATPRVVALVSDRWGDFGVLASAAYSTADVNEYGYRNWGWGRINVAAANIGPGVAPADAARLASAVGGERVMAPSAETYSTWFDHRARLGLTAALQYHPGARLKLDLDLLYGTLSNDRHEYALAAAGANPLTGDVVGTQRLNAAAIVGDSLVYGAFTGVDLRTEHKHSYDKTTFTQAVFNGSYQLSRALIARGMVGYSRSDFQEPVFDKVFLQAPGKAFSYDMRNGATNTYGFDITDPSQWSLMRADAREDAVINAFTTAKLDLDYDTGHGSVLKVAAQSKLFRNDGYQRHTRVDYAGVAIPSSMKSVFDQRSLAPYVVGNVDAIYALTGQNRNLTSADDVPGADYSITERTFAAYAAYQFDGTLLDRRVRLDAGLRYYATHLTSAGMVNLGAGLVPAVISHRYQGVLPAVSLAWDVSEEVVARFSANRNISRPSLSDLRAAGNVDSAPFGGTISAGNPNLRPFTADSVEAALEVYRGRAGYFVASLFYKNMDSFITTENAFVPYNTTGYPLQFLSPGVAPSTPYGFNRPVNGSGASIHGLELTAQMDFIFLPPPFDRLGFVGNLTYAQGRSGMTIDGKSYSLSLPQLSKWSSNATLYYETPRWGARISSAFRSGYLDGAGGAGNIGSGYRASNNVDFAAHYNAGPGLKVVVEGINLTDQAIVQYTDVHAGRVIADTSSGRTFTLGVTYEF